MCIEGLTGDVVSLSAQLGTIAHSDLVVRIKQTIILKRVSSFDLPKYGVLPGEKKSCIRQQSAFILKKYYNWDDLRSIAHAFHTTSGDHTFIS